MHLAAAREVAAPLLPVYPYLVVGTGVLLGWGFRRIQVVLALVVLFAAERTLALATLDPAPLTLARGIALLLPLDLALLAWTSERFLLGSGGAWVALVILAQPLALVLLSRPELAGLRPLLAAPGPGWLPGFGAPALGAFAAAGGLILLRVVARPTVIHTGFAWALLAAALGLAVDPVGRSVYLATGGLVLVLALVETSHRMAYEDELTGLPARRALNEALLRLGERYAIAMVDIDHFKRFNDQHGHAAGDQLLRKVAGLLTAVGGGARAFRYGGEEFALLFPGGTVKEALPHLEQLRRTVAAAAFTLRGADRPRRRPDQPLPATGPRRRVAVTVSIGVAGAEQGLAEPDEVIRAADRKLYAAKQAGRNRVVA